MPLSPGVSGSVVGLSVGGVPVSSNNPVPITGSFSLAAGTQVTTVSGSVTGLLVGGVAVSDANPVPDLLQSGSVTGLLVGGVSVSQANPVPISSTTINSGSVSGLLVGGVPVSNANAVPVTLQGSSISLDVTASLAAGSSVTLNSGSITGLLVGGVAVSSANPVPEVLESGSLTGLLVGGVAVSNANAVPVTLQGSGISLDVTASIPDGVTVNSGSVIGLLYGGNPASSANPIYVTGTIASPVYTTDNETTLTCSFTSSVALYPNVHRLGASMYNGTNGSIYVKFGSPATSSSFKYVIPPTDTLEFGNNPIFTGAVTVIWDPSGAGPVPFTGLLQISEQTP